MSWKMLGFVPWTKRFMKEVWNPSKARAWHRRELDRRSNVRRKKRAKELERRRKQNA